MSLEPGQALLHYRLVEQIGEGGMGVVWKAEDTSLHREVAIKVLPPTVSEDPERLVRFDREAKLLASLNHANIASVYGLHEAPSTSSGQVIRFLAMEFVQGEDLAKRLARGRMSVDVALGVGRQVADALQSAHENGVVHRDLKPANIVITPEGQAKVLDFGLAKAFEADPSAPVSPTLSPTLTSAGTVAGVILGTAAYMSPEQARGEPADKRADVWAFGCVLFEMLAGRMTFKENTISDTLASVLKVEPNWDLLPADVPESIHRLLKRCIQKDPRQRLHDIADARIEIEETLAAPRQAPPAATATPTPRPRARLLLTAVLVLLGVAAGLVVGRNLAPSAPEQRVRRFFLPVGAEEGQESLGTPVISPDGRTIVYVFDNKLWLRDLDQVKPRPLDGTKGARRPFWSPDGSQIGYRVGNALWRIPTSGGQPTLITDRGPNIYNGSWANETIVFPKNDEMFEVPARGGEPKLIFEANEEADDDFHNVHQLPGGRGLVFVLHRKEGVDTLALWADGKRRILLTLESSRLGSPTYSSTGHILFTRRRNNEGVWALPFSLSSLEVTGEPFLVVPQAATASASADGTLIYMDASTGQGVELVWFDADGAILGTIGQPQEEIWNPALSPDGTKVAVASLENDDWDIWIHDVNRHNKNKLTFDPDREGMPRWSTDGNRVFYHSAVTGDDSIYTVEADGSGRPRLLTEGRQATLTRSESHIVFTRTAQETDGDLWSMALEGEAEPTLFLQTEAKEHRPVLSPDGRFVAYVSDESGENQIYIKPFPEGPGKWQVSVDGGWRVYWSPVGDRVYFFERGSLMEVELSTDPVVRLSTPRKLIDADKTELTIWRGIAITEDGTRFIGTRNYKADDGEEEVEDGIYIVENWFSDFSD